jgi:hypothetical protein
MSLLEQAIESPAGIVLRPTGFGDDKARSAGSEKIAEIRLFPIRDPLGVRLSAAITKCGVIVCTIHARVKIRPAFVAFIRSCDESLYLDLGSTMMTVHTGTTPLPPILRSFSTLPGFGQKIKSSLYSHSEYRCFQAATNRKENIKDRPRFSLYGNQKKGWFSVEVWNGLAPHLRRFNILWAFSFVQL